MSISYNSTAVPVERSKQAIRDLLIKFGARGVQFSEDFETGLINVRFAKNVDGTMRTVSVTMRVPDPPRQKRPRRHAWSRHGRTIMPKTDAIRREQMARATYRALHYWIKSQYEAVQFGLFSFEDAFLSHFEWMLDGRATTVGKIILPRLPSSNLLAAPTESEPVEGVWDSVPELD
jgi:hypothetical protein